MPVPGITSINQNTGTCDVDGGIVYSHGTLCSNVTDMTIDADGQVTGFVTVAVGSIGKLQYDTDQDVAYFNETGARTGKKHVLDQESVMPFDGLTKEKIKAGDNAAAACCNLFIHTHSTGLKRMQGVEVDKEAGTWKLSKKPALVTVNNNSNTGDASDNMQWTVTSQSKYAAPIVDMTDAEIEAL